MIVREIFAKSVLLKSQIYDYAINPYVGCSHSCRYCYAAFMRRFTGHREKWGEFVDVKINAPELLAGEIGRKRMGRVWVSGVCDPYFPSPPWMTKSEYSSSPVPLRSRIGSMLWIFSTQRVSGLLP